MDPVLASVLVYWWIMPIVASLIFYKYVLRLLGIIIIPDDSVGKVIKKFVLFGKNKTLPDGKIIALLGEAGFQAETLAPGVHFWYWPWQYQIDVEKFIKIPDGQVGIVIANDGTALPAGRVLGKRVESDSFQSASLFLKNGGERGPQLEVMPPGTYRINTALFTIKLAPAVEIPDNKIGLVTTKEGAPLPTGDIAARTIIGHNTFQNPQKFIDAGGSKGLQEEVMRAGRYFINPLFATIEITDMTTVPIATVGVVISYVGEVGADVTGEAFKHGNLVEKGKRGVWVTPLDPGKYPVNPHTHKVENVPTANVVLNWATGKTEAHNLDKNLSTITVRSSDGFKFNLDVSQIIHIPQTEAPKVIARFGNMQNLVTQVLEPTIGNYFRNTAQKSDVIDFLNSRQTRQDEAKKSISNALNIYNVNAVDTLIGDITPPEQLMEILARKKIAEQEKVTFETQKEAQVVKQQLEQATAMAMTQAQVVAAERQVSIRQFEADAMIKKAEGDAASKTINAEADAKVFTVTGKAQAIQIREVGGAEADVIKQKIASIEPDKYAAIEVAKHLASSGVKWVPEIVAGGNNGGSLVEILTAQLVQANQKHVTEPSQK